MRPTVSVKILVGADNLVPVEHRGTQAGKEIIWISIAGVR